MVVMMNFSANVDHALNQENLSPGYIETTHSDEKKSHKRKSKPGARQILKDVKRISKKSIMDLSARKKDKNS